MTTETFTVRDIVTDAYRKAGIVASDEPMTADQAAAGARALGRMLKAWQNRGWGVFRTSRMSVAATTSAQHTLSPVRPVRIESVRFKRGGIETPMQSLTGPEYDDLPLKTSPGTPTNYYYDRQREEARLYVWPVPASVTTETFEITYEREAEDSDLNAVVDVPGEWWEAVVYSLADRLGDDFGVGNQKITARAEAEVEAALAMDRSGSVFF